jgi:CRISPR-associated protein Csm2
MGIDQDIIKEINKTKAQGFKSYPIRTLVEQSEQFGYFLKNSRLETNQIRKFLDAINRVKVKLNQDKDDQQIFNDIEPEIVLLKPKLAYAAARQKAAKPLSDVMSIAIDNVKTVEDFKRLIQFVESIIAYHKSAGGK